MAKRRRPLLVLGAALLLLLLDAVVYLVFVQPLRSGQADEKATALQSQMDRATAEVARLERIERELPGATRRLDEFVNQQFLAEEVGYSGLVGELERAATDMGVRPGRIDFLRYPVRERPELVRVETTTTLEGSYANLLRFLEALERSGNFYLLKRLGLASTTPGGKLKLDLTLETYLRRGRA